MTLLIIIVIFLLLGSAFCSSCEAALFSVSEFKIHSLHKEKKINVDSLLKIKKNIASSVASIVLLNNVFNISGTILAGVVASEVLVQDWKIAIFSGILTFLIILFGEILPKTFGERFALPYALLVAKPLLVIK